MNYIDVYNAGKKAFKDGYTIEDNPYTEPEHREWWNIGWNDGHCADLVKSVKTGGADGLP